MDSIVNVAIHASQFPDQVRRDLQEGLRTRRVNPKFHYDSVKQTQKWLELHQAYSPSRNDADCQQVYESAFQAAARCATGPRVHLISLGCGGGQKDLRLIQALQSVSKQASYSPTDVSVAMVLTARHTVLAEVPGLACHPVVLDLAAVGDWSFLRRESEIGDAPRLVSFLGMIPNFEPRDVLPRLAPLLRKEDALVLSANLAPGADYDAGIERILPQYDNSLTRDWLMTLLTDLGVAPKDGGLSFSVEECPAGTGLKRIVGRFEFRRARRLMVAEERFAFTEGETIQLFYSYRYTPQRLADVLSQYDIKVLHSWITRSQEEGVFLCSRTESRSGVVKTLGACPTPT